MESFSFKDFLFHANLRRQAVKIGTHFIVIERDGENYVEAQGIVRIYAVKVWFDKPVGEAYTQEELDTMVESNALVLTYTADLDRATGYAQGVYDGLALTAGAAGSSS